MEIKRAVITSAGMATRMRPISNVIPKGLLPVFKSIEGRRCTAPVVDLIMESLANAGIDNLCFVVGSNSKLLMDYLFERDVTFVFQNEPKGFGDAVLRAERFVDNEPFFLHTNDDLLTGGYKEATAVFKKLDADCLLMLAKVPNPKMFGIAEVEHHKEMESHKVFRIKRVEEKPQSPKSDIAICGVYIFSPMIFDRLRKNIKHGRELVLTDAIQDMVEGGCRVYGMLLEKETWLGLGNPDDYFRALSHSYSNL